MILIFLFFLAVQHPKSVAGALDEFETLLEHSAYGSTKQTSWSGKDRHNENEKTKMETPVSDSESDSSGKKEILGSDNERSSSGKNEVESIECHNKGCYVLIAALPDEHQPIYLLRIDGVYQEAPVNFTGQNHFILSPQEKLYMGCPENSNSNNSVHKLVEYVCKLGPDGNYTFYDKEEPKKIEEITCEAEVRAEHYPTNAECGNGEGKLFILGYNVQKEDGETQIVGTNGIEKCQKDQKDYYVKQTFAEDTRKNNEFPLRNKRIPANAEVQTSKLEEIFPEEETRRNLDELQSSLYDLPLLSDDDFPLQNTKKAVSEQYRVLQYKTIKLGHMNDLEYSIKETAIGVIAQKMTRVDVYTGMVWSDKNDHIPTHIWKIVHAPSVPPTVIIVQNNPEKKDSDIKFDCECKLQRNILQYPDVVHLGHVDCCSYDEFKKIIPFSPDLKV